MNQPKKRRFPAKRYGWGWGAPRVWQGWIVVLLYGVLMAVGGLLIEPGKNVLLFIASVVVVTGALGVVCWLNGEPPAWRWGKADDHPQGTGAHRS